MATPTFEIDMRERTLMLHASTGETAKGPLPPGMLEQDTNIERFAVSAGLGEVLIGLPGGHEATVELRGTKRPLDEVRAATRGSSASTSAATRCSSASSTARRAARRATAPAIRATCAGS